MFRAILLKMTMKAYMKAEAMAHISPNDPRSTFKPFQFTMNIPVKTGTKTKIFTTVNR